MPRQISLATPMLETDHKPGHVTSTMRIRARRWAFPALVGVTITATLSILWVPHASSPFFALLTAIFGGWFAIMLLTPWPEARSHERDVEAVRRLIRNIRRYGSDKERPPLRELLLKREDHLGELSRAVHDALASSVPGRIEAGAVQRELGQQILKQTRRETAKLKQESRTDLLTGLGNRRILNEAFERLLDENGKCLPGVGILVIDVDRFKQINDRLGHDVGDRCLAFLGNLLGSSLRADDCAVRSGGDEFIVLMKRQTTYGAELVAQRLQELFRQMPWDHPDPEKPTLSMGIAIVYHPGSVDREAALKLADQAMYASKRAGRNLVTISGAERDAA